MSEPSQLSPNESVLPPAPERRIPAPHRKSSATFNYLTARLEGQARPATVRNISSGGITVYLDRWLEPETIVMLELINRGMMFSCRLPLRVVYMLERPSGDWILGGAFARKLSEDEMHALL